MTDVFGEYTYYIVVLILLILGVILLKKVAGCVIRILIIILIIALAGGIYCYFFAPETFDYVKEKSTPLIEEVQEKA